MPSFAVSCWEKTHAALYAVTDALQIFTTFVLVVLGVGFWIVTTCFLCVGSAMSTFISTLLGRGKRGGSNE